MKFNLKSPIPAIKTKYQLATPMTQHMVKMLLFMGLLLMGIVLFKATKIYLMIRFFAGQDHSVTVSAMRVHYDEWQPKLKAVGSLRAVRGVDVTTELAGLVQTIAFTPGASAKTGDLLVQLNAGTDIAQLHALEAAAELAKITYQRDKAQYAIHAISKATLDADAADAKSKAAQVAAQSATVAKKTLRAPFDGRLGICAVNPGQYVNPGDKVVTLQMLNPIYADFHLPQQTLSQLKVGQTITLTTDTYPKSVFAGKISTIDPKVDPSTRNVAIEATLDNSKLQLLPGLFGNVEIITGKPIRYLTLPQTAISYNAYGDMVFLVKQTGKTKEGKPLLTVNQVFVVTGSTRGDQVAILSGLNEGDWVVTAGQMKLQNSSVVKINNTVLPSNDPNPHPVNE